MNSIGSKISDKNKDNIKNFKKLIDNITTKSKKINKGGGTIALQRQHSKGRLFVRERIKDLIDPASVS